MLTPQRPLLVVTRLQVEAVAAANAAAVSAGDWKEAEVSREPARVTRLV